MSSYGLVLLVLALLKDMSRRFPLFEKHKSPVVEMCIGRAFTHFFMVYGDTSLFNETIITN